MLWGRGAGALYIPLGTTGYSVTREASQLDYKPLRGAHPVLLGLWPQKPARCLHSEVRLVKGLNCGCTEGHPGLCKLSATEPFWIQVFSCHSSAAGPEHITHLLRGCVLYWMSVALLLADHLGVV